MHSREVRDAVRQEPINNRALRITLTIGASLAALILCLGLPTSDFAGWALLSVLVFHVSLRPRLRELALTLVPAVVFWVSYTLLFRLTLGFRPGPVFVLGTLGAGSLVTLSVRAVWSEERERARVLSVLFPAIGLLVFLLAKQGLPNLAAHQNGTYDLYLFLVDGTFGFQPALLIEKFFRIHPGRNLLILIVYDALPVAMAIVYVDHLRRCRSRYYMLRLFLVAAVLGWALYNVVPAVGPIYFFGRDFVGPIPTYRQLGRLALERVILASSVYRNAMPSLHMTWALLLWWNARRLGRPTYWVAAIFALLTVLSTLGTGEHYFVDLVVAFPFALFVQSLCTRQVENSWIRIGALGTGAGLTGAWMLVVRTDPKLFLVSIALPWACTLVTLGLAQIVFFKLENAVDAVFWDDQRRNEGIEGRAECLLQTSTEHVEASVVIR